MGMIGGSFCSLASFKFSQPRFFNSNLQSKVQITRKKANSIIARQGPSDVFVLDFDGVLVDSLPEITNSGLQFAKDLWPQKFEGVDENKQLDLLKQTRPVLIEGFEIVVMARMLAENSSCISDILQRWPQQMADILTEWKLDADKIKMDFENYRVALQKEKSEEWVKLNQGYPGVKEALMYCEYPFYVVSSKSGGRVAHLLEKSLGIKGISQDSPRLLASLLPPDTEKPKALKQIGGRPICSDTGARLHFIDDRLSTLEAIMEDPSLQNWRLYLAEWGYMSPLDKQRVEQGLSDKGIVSLSLTNFLELLKWGILMGVDDGCEPTKQEVEAGVTQDLQRTQ
eukprot:TRINITY_DN14042_c2_g2_i2.p1 TRINITY_DN14042_c2_g2~~TRINITY_DN14042_c2_g2_i2.p1  ORF type:complete len:340 (+),score=44.47 TRINITY_DN14042_c2_g2_i2:344-1363(+)